MNEVDFLQIKRKLFTMILTNPKQYDEMVSRCALQLKDHCWDEAEARVTAAKIITSILND